MRFPAGSVLLECVADIFGAARASRKINFHGDLAFQVAVAQFRWRSIRRRRFAENGVAEIGRPSIQSNLL